jgi:hypothetical protein
MMTKKKPSGVIFIQIVLESGFASEILRQSGDKQLHFLNLARYNYQGVQIVLKNPHLSA